MADVTISQLTQGTPSASAAIPYSDGNTTYSARPSAIVAASSGSVLQMQFVPYVERYLLNPMSRSTWTGIGPSLNITTRSNNSKIFLSNNISVAIQNVNSGYIYAMFSFSRGGVEITNKDFGIVTRTQNIGWDNMTVQFVDSPNVAAGTTLTYQLMVKGRDGTSYANTRIDINDSGAGTLTHFTALEIAG